MNQSLKSIALTHKSYCNEHPNSTSYERLEFLGDSILSFIISRRLFDLLPGYAEGELTTLRSFLVQTTTLAQKAKDLGIDQQIKMSKGEEESGGRSNPSVLADTFEAVLAAKYLEEGLMACETFLNEVFPDELLLSSLPTKDPKSLLQEKTQSAGMGTPTYTTIESQGPDHAKVFTVAVIVNSSQVATASGTSKQRAQTQAATLALAKLFPV